MTRKAIEQAIRATITALRAEAGQEKVCPKYLRLVEAAIQKAEAAVSGEGACVQNDVR